MLFPMPGVKNYDQLASFTTEVNTIDPAHTTGQMLGSPAIVTARHGKGVVVAMSVHPELSIGDGSLDTPNLLELMRGIVRLAAPDIDVTHRQRA